MHLETLICALFSLAFLAGLSMRDSRAKTLVSSFSLLLALMGLGVFSYGVIAGSQSISYVFSGMPLFRVDLLGAYFLFLLSAVGIGVALYSIYYFEEYRHHGQSLRFYISLSVVFLASLVGVIMANEVTTFLVFWEIMSFSSFLLVVGNPKEENVLFSWAYYLIITHIGMFFIFLSFLPLIAASHTTMFSGWTDIGAGLPMAMKHLVFFAALVGFGSKAGLVPIHVWLPRAHAVAPSNISALMSAFMIKLPLLFLFKFVFVFFGRDIPLSWGVTVLIVALLSSFFGVFHALIQSNFKKLLAYSSIENIGIIFIGFGVAMIGCSIHDELLVVLGFFGCVYHLVNHAFFKTLMFLGAGSLIERTGSKRFDGLGGLAKRLPFLAKILLIGSLSIAAIPPLNGFISEFVTYLGLIIGTRLANDNLAILFFSGVIVLAITSVFAFITFVNFYGVAFLGEPRTDITVKTESNIFERLAFVYLAGMLVLLSIVPWYMLDIVHHLLQTYHIASVASVSSLGAFAFTVHSILSYDNLMIFAVLVSIATLLYILSKTLFGRVRIVESWTCGYQNPVPRAQYTAFSMIQPLRRIFSYLYLESKTQKRRDKEGLYAKHGMDFEYRVKDHFILERLIYDPIILGLKRFNYQVKRIQSGDLQMYLLYMFGTVLILFALYSHIF